ALDANNYFSRLLGAPKPVRERNQFGGAAGGPLVKNRTFWFGDYEGPRNRWDPVGAAIVALIPDPNVPGSTIYASTPVTDTRQDQFDVRLDHQVRTATSMFARYSFVDT